jgi:ATP-binding cassette subfamily B multidrug efflux pump
MRTLGESPSSSDGRRPIVAARRPLSAAPGGARDIFGPMSDPHDEAAITKAYDPQLMRRLLRYLKPHWRSALVALALLVCSSALQLIGPLATAVTLDLFIKPVVEGGAETADPVFAAGLVADWLDVDGATLTVPEARRFVVGTAIFYAGVLALIFGVLFGQGYVLQSMGQRVMFDLRRDVFARLQQLPVAFFDRQPIGRLVTRATTDVEALNELFTSGLVSVFGDLCLLLGIAAVLFLLDWRLALVTMAIIPLLLLLTAWFKRHARESFREVRIKIARINAFLQEHMGGMSIVQLFGREEVARGEFGTINEAHREANVRGVFYYAVYFPMVELITALGLALIVWYGGGRAIQGALSLGALVAFLQYAQRFYQPLADLSERYNILQGAMASSERIFELLDTPTEIETPPGAYLPERVRGDLELDDVSFSYKAGEQVLSHISFRIAAGETVAVVGHSGAGKSTLANLLLRFYDVDSGVVRIDGVDVRQWDLRRLRTSIGMVLQDVLLFSGDVAGNLRLGNAEIDDARLADAVREVGAEGLIASLPAGYATELKERGAGLSVGQKQLLAFARALAFDPEILILDEATASIDSESEEQIQKALARLLVGRTSLVIAHRLSTIQRADRILVLHKGQLREMGKHHELLALRGIYYRLHQLQFQDDQAPADTAQSAVDTAAPEGLPRSPDDLETEEDAPILAAPSPG